MIFDKTPEEKDEYEPPAFKEILRELRMGKKLTQASLAHHLQYGASAITNYESGRNEPDIKNLIKLADFFDVSLDYLIRKEVKSFDTDMKEQIQLINNYMKLTDEEKNFIQHTIAFIMRDKPRRSTVKKCK